MTETQAIPANKLAMIDVVPALEKVVYIGFWPRCVATIVDWLIISAAALPLAIMLGWVDLGGGMMAKALQAAFSAIIVLSFWFYKSATPGKMLCRAVIADAETLQKPNKRKLIIRYFAFIVSFVPLGLGCLWVAFDARKQGWHDKIAGTVVIKGT